MLLQLNLIASLRTKMVTQYIGVCLHELFDSYIVDFKTS